EKLSSALLEDLEVDGSGIDETYGFNAGIDINLKFGDYTDLTLRRVTVTDSGITGSQANPLFPVAVTIKARDDGDVYGAVPATLTGVLVDDCTISGPVNGLAFGEPGKLNLGPSSVVVVDSDLVGTSGYAALNH